MFPLNLNFQTRFNLKKLLDTIEDYTNHLVDETEQLLNIVKQGVARKEDSLFASSSATIEIKSSETNNENRDLLSIFFSPEVKDLNKSIKSTSIVSAGSLDQDGSQSKDSADLESVPSPLFRVWEGMPQSDVPEHLEPDLETEILTSFKYRGPICTYLDANELPADLLGTSCWLMRYIGSVARILLAKVKEIETGLSIALLKDKPEMAPISLPVREASFKKRPTMRTGPSTVGLLDPYLSSSRQTSHRRSKASQRKTKESGLSGFGLDQMSDEEDEDADELEDEPEEDAKVEPEPDHKPATPTTTRDSPFSPPTEESSDQMEAFADLLRQLDVAENLSRIKPKEALTPIYLTQKTSQVIQRNNLLQLENTALEIFLSKQQVTVNFNLLACADEVQPTWGQLLNDMQFRVHPVDAEIKASVRDTGTVTPEASLDHGQTRSQSITSSFGDSDTIEQLTSSALPELTRYVYAPAREVIAFEPISSDHRYDVQPPHYRLMPIEEAVKRADERRDLKKRLIQAKKEIVRTFLKEIESESDSGADEDEEPAGWRKWFPYRRRAELVAEAVDRLVALEAALHSEAIKTLQELSARKRTIVKEIAEKIEDHKTLASLQETKDAPQKKKWLCQRRFSDVLYK
ncbi:Hypothetical protein NTJ_12742 [Nesidiocoris tenuis]|uniref:Uncharacterized protein n=1 Tax=Nesidiocoris tenuis TaxID=355587 RepID=A0ABN7BAT4_9HEMI|nr:Hypothetical protein NTJ_12742 [Nesidiocoris tenuis]